MGRVQSLGNVTNPVTDVQLERVAGRNGQFVVLVGENIAGMVRGSWGTDSFWGYDNDGIRILADFASLEAAAVAVAAGFAPARPAMVA